jgi:hypothetical protein
MLNVVEPPTLTLYSSSLLSKWGFNDGDMPNVLMDYWDACSIDYSNLEWHQVLCRLIRLHLLPALTIHHDIELIELETIHNPIRILVCDGRNMMSVWTENRMDVPQLHPESVVVRYDDVADACGVDVQ